MKFVRLIQPRSETPIYHPFILSRQNFSLAEYDIEQVLRLLCETDPDHLYSLLVGVRFLLQQFLTNFSNGNDSWMDGNAC